MAQNMQTKEPTSGNNQSARHRIAEIVGDEQLSASAAAAECVKQFARERPEVVALWAFGIGFVLGWKLKPW